MPVKIWELEAADLRSHVVTEWEREWTSEEFRTEADDLDTQLDAVLDEAVRKISEPTQDEVPNEFLRAWAVGACLNEADLLRSPAMEREQPQLLWRALARKIRTGARSDGTLEEKWHDLRPQRAEEPRREGRKLDHFEMCRWLAQQSLEDSAETFGGSIRNVWQMLERPTLARAPAVRVVLLAWLRSLPRDQRERCYDTKVFAEMMKVLRARWPDRGPGAAKKPIHYSQEQLEPEIRRLLAPFASAAP
jgi:hypothetical protein